MMEDSMELPLISIIVVSYDGSELTERCVRSVLKNTRYPNYEVIVVKYGPKATEGLKDIEGPRVKVVRIPKNVGYSEANNIGLRHARGSFLAFLNNDTIVTDGWLKALYELLASSGPDVAAVQSKLRLAYRPERIDAVGMEFSPLGFLRPVGYMELDRGQYDRVTELCVIQPAACLIRREALARVGGLFDPDYFWGHEDTDLSLRMHLAGYRMLLCPSSLVYHVRSATISKARPEALTYYFRRNVLLTMLKNYGLRELARWLPLHMAVLAAMVVWHLISGRGLHAIAVLKAIWWNVRNIRAVLNKRAFVQARVRRIPDGALVAKLRGPSLPELLRERHEGPLSTTHLGEGLLGHNKRERPRGETGRELPRGGERQGLGGIRSPGALLCNDRPTSPVRPRVSVVVVTHNRPDYCDELLESLENQTVKPYEVIVIDDASTPPYRPKKGRGLRLRLFRSERELGVGLARFLGSRLAEGDVIAFIDDDAVAPEKWVERLAEGYRHGLHVWGGPALPIYGAKRPWWWDERALGIYSGVFNRILIACNYAIRRETLELIGYFKPYLGRYGGTLISNEEVEYTLRAALKGLRVGYDHALFVRHRVRPEEFGVRRLLRRAWDQGLSTAATVGLKLRLAIWGSHLRASKFIYGRQGPVKLSAKIIRGVLLLTTFVSYLFHALMLHLRAPPEILVERLKIEELRTANEPEEEGAVELEEGEGRPGEEGQGSPPEGKPGRGVGEYRGQPIAEVGPDGP